MVSKWHPSRVVRAGAHGGRAGARGVSSHPLAGSRYPCESTGSVCRSFCFSWEVRKWFLFEISQFLNIGSWQIFTHFVGQGDPAYFSLNCLLSSLCVSPAWNPSLLRADQLSAQIPG